MYLPHLLRHDPLEGGAGVVVLPHLHEEDPDVVHDLDPQSLVSVGHLDSQNISHEPSSESWSSVPGPEPSDNT